MKREPKVFSGLLGLILLGGLASGLIVSRVDTGTAEAVPVASVTYENLQNIPILAPDGDPQGLAVLLSDRGPTTAADRSLASDLVDAGFVVLPVGIDAWVSALDADDEGGDCIYLGSDLEGIAKEALRTLKLDTYFHPVVVGRGEGGLLAYAAVADAPAATLAGGVSLDTAASVHSKLPVCEGAKATAAAKGSFAYDRADADLPQPFTFVEASGETRETPMKAPFTAGAVNVQDPDDRQDAAIDAAAAIAANDRSELPIVVGKPIGDPIATAIFFSGDGGWRDLDKTIGDWLTAHGVEVVGVDSLRYFWAEKTPEQMATDIATMIGNIKPKPGVPIALLGYSFGADTLPFAFPHLPPEITDRVSLIGLLAPSMETGFQISVGGWLGMSTGDRGVVAAAAALPAAKVLCVYGTEDDDTACIDPKLAGTTLLPIEGGHHFDENYDAMASRLLQAIRSGPPAALAAATP